MDSVEQLVRAAVDGDGEQVTRLLGEGVPVDARDREHRTALDRALWAGQLSSVSLLLSAGADTEQPIGEYRETLPLRFAAEREMQDIARVLLEAGADPDGRLCEGRATALMVAAQEGHTGIAQMLLDHDAAIELAGRGMTALEWAASAGRPATVRLLLEHGAACVPQALAIAGECHHAQRSPERQSGYATTISILQG
ncbi:ankyrin repeat domain-containing protein [Streptomyces pinistramenti]|uniref:ankyrin repeat domain-containing protein n=1 Tax=Streptomyces pinistramenti TaxID=2884812 RepID=UPI001D071EC6|nr:ankyrin repeat domain-containing protein [Streptomyces pinistramenti]MCB5908202.1 ankyrin repeat domain-containing protein [Streptomyces pinistramenti]